MNTVQSTTPSNGGAGDATGDLENVGIVKEATEDQLGASLSIQHRTINNRTINGEQVATRNAGQVLFMKDDLSTRQGNTVSLTQGEFVLLIAATMSE